MEARIRLFLPTLLIPLGVAFLLLGVYGARGEERLAIALVTLGAIIAVLGAFGPRMEGVFKLSPHGAEARLNEAPKDAVRDGGFDRLEEAATEGELSAGKRVALQQAVEDIAERVPPPERRRAFYARPTHPRAASSLEDSAAWREMGKAIADALLTAARD